MKYIVAALLTLTTFHTFSAEKMGPEALEMYSVLSHHQVVECLRNVPSRMINVTIEKEVARCPGCNSYKIAGNELNIDIPRSKKTVITIKGSAVRDVFGGYVQTYSCDID